MLISELLAGLTTKLAGLGMAAKAATGLAVAAAAVTSAGAAGVLPAPVQHAVSTTVGAATPFTFPDSARAQADAHAGVAANTGVTGLDRANQTPAAGRAPIAVPVPGAVGSQASTGLGTTAGTPAAGHVPTSVPVAPAGAGTQASTGLGTAAGTPAAGHIPASVPGRP